MKMQRCGRAALAPASALAAVFCAGLAAASGIGADADGSLRWLDWFGLILQAAPWLVVAAGIYLGQQSADEIKQELHANMAAQLEIIKLLAGRNG